MVWTWKNYWDWFITIPYEYKVLNMQELNRDNWLSQLPANVQINVMENAPEEILHSLKYFPSIFKSETIEILGDENE